MNLTIIVYVVETNSASHSVAQSPRSAADAPSPYVTPHVVGGGARCGSYFHASSNG